MTLVVAFALALPIAWLIERTDFPGKPVVFTLMTVALLIPGFAVALGWLFLLHPRIGLINQALMALFGLDEAPFDISDYLRHGRGRGPEPHADHLHHDLGGVARDGPGARGSRRDERREALAGGLARHPARAVARRCWRPPIYVAAICFAAFDVPAILGLTNRIFTFSTYVFRELTPTEGAPEYGDVATLSVIMLVIAVLMSWSYRAVQRQAPRIRRRHRQGLSAAHRAARPRSKDRPIGFVAAFFLVSQALPLADARLGVGAAVPADRRRRRRSPRCRSAISAASRPSCSGASSATPRS